MDLLALELDDDFLAAKGAGQIAKLEALSLVGDSAASFGLMR